MGVNKVVYGGRVIFDITDSTIRPGNMLAGTVGYGANGERLVGTVTAQSFYAKAKRVEIVLPASGWVLSDGVYTQQIAADVAATDNPFSQCVLSADYATAVDEMREIQWLEKIETYDGYIIASCFDCPGMEARPDVGLTISLVIVDGITEATMAAIACANAKQITVTAPASVWEWDGHTYRQTVAADIQASDVLFGDGLFSMDLTAALDEMTQLPRITDALPGNGSLELICYDQDNKGAPNVDITLTFKVFATE